MTNFQNNSMFSYILLGFTFLAVSRETLAGRCTSNDTGGALQVNDRCYWMIREHLIFTDAHKRCQEDGGILAEIPDTETQNAVEGFFLSLSTNYWIGVHDIYQENNFVNMLNETVLYTKWASRQPNNLHYGYTNADCVKMASDGWFDVPCTLSMSAICSKRSNDRCLLHYGFNVSGRYYWKVWEDRIFAEAHTRCQDCDGMLAEIPDQTAQTKITEFLSVYSTGFWIGVNDMKKEGIFMNMLNETVNYTNWASGEPNKCIQSYLSVYPNCDCVMIKSGEWYDKPCSRFLPALCSQRYDFEQIQTQSSSLPVPYTSVHTTTLSTTTTTTTTTTDLSTKYQTSEKNTDHLTTKNITVSQTSEQITSKSTTTDLTTVFQTYEQRATQSTTTDLLPMSQTNEELATEPTTTYQSKVSQTSDHTTTLSSTQFTTMDHSAISQTSVQTFTQSATTDSSSILQTMQTTSNVQSTVGTTLHVNQQRECICPCSRMKNVVIIKNEAELLTKIDKMKKELAVKKSSLSSSIRKKTSAVDPRPSASIVGGTISVVVIATVVGLIVLSDLTRVINFCWKTISKRCNRKTRAAQKGKV